MPDPQPPQTESSGDTGFVPGDDGWTLCRNLYSIFTGRMTDKGKEQFRVAQDIRHEAADCKRCEDQRDYLLQYSVCYPSPSPFVSVFFANADSMRKGPVIRFMSDTIRQLGGDLSSHNIYCRRCSNRKAGGFDPNYGILLCANEMRDQGHVEDTMAHEMVHAYDHLRFKVDWADNLRHAACTEVWERNHIDCSDISD